MSAPRIEEELPAAAQVLLDRLRKLVVSRRVRVVWLACATRVALDALPLKERGPGFVLRTWDLPEISSTTQEATRAIMNSIERILTSATGRALLLSRATRLAIDDLSPDEQSGAVAEATQIIGTPP